VVYLEAKGLYNLRHPVPEGDVEIPIGRAGVLREGRQVSIFAYGPAVHEALAAAEILGEGVAEVVDLRSLAPLDEEAILRSVAKTHRAVIVHEDARTGGVGAEIAARIAEKALYELEAPVVRVAAPDTPVPYAPSLEAAYHARDVAAAVRDLLR
jgi:pyruvate/2-oxoglutarate/acetoin dehydrogenase E1 component